jgi:hypothetical protein
VIGQSAGEPYRRLGVWAFAKNYLRRGNLLVDIAASKSILFPRRRYADTPTRRPADTLPQAPEVEACSIDKPECVTMFDRLAMLNQDCR